MEFPLFGCTALDLPRRYCWGATETKRISRESLATKFLHPRRCHAIRSDVAESATVFRMSQQQGTWLRADYPDEGVLALEMLVEQLRQIENDVYRWKWAIVVGHNALHAFMVAALQATNHLGAYSDSYTKHWEQQYSRGLPATRQEKLADFPVLLERVQKLKGFVDGSPYLPTDEEKERIGKLNKWRGEFIHYKPRGLSLEVSGFPEILRVTLEAIRFLAFDSMYVFRGQTPWSKRTEVALSEAHELLAAIEVTYEQVG